jgi:hypothetical protein
MTKEQYWQRLREQYPNIETATVCIRPEAFRRFFDDVWRHASREPDCGEWGAILTMFQQASKREPR